MYAYVYILWSPFGPFKFLTGHDQSRLVYDVYFFLFILPSTSYDRMNRLIFIVPTQLTIKIVSHPYPKTSETNYAISYTSRNIIFV